MSTLDRKLGVGVVGYGWAATAHIDAINNGSAARVTAVASSRALDAGELSARHHAPIRVHRDIGALLDDPAVDVVSITSYPWEHASQAVAAAAAGKHIILEKPMALSLADVDRVAAAVRAAGVGFCLCFEARFSHQFLTTRRIIESGLLGEIHYGEVDYYHGIGPWYGQFRWNVKTAGGGSSLLSAGCHALDALLLCLESEVVEVTSLSARSRSEIFADYEYDTTSVTILRFADGKVGKCASSIDCFQPYYFHTHLVGSEGSLLDRKIHSHKLGLDKSRWSELSMKLMDSGDVADHPYRSQFDAFFESIAQGKPMPLTGLDEALRTHETIFAADLSAARGEAVRLDSLRGLRS